MSALELMPAMPEAAAVPAQLNAGGSSSQPVDTDDTQQELDSVLAQLAAADLAVTADDRSRRDLLDMQAQVRSHGTRNHTWAPGRCCAAWLRSMLRCAGLYITANGLRPIR